MGACIRNWQGFVIAFKVDVLLDGTNNLVEAQALLACLIFPKRCNISTLHIEGDSQVFVNSCLSQYSHTWKLAYILQECLDLIESYHPICFSHTLRRVINWLIVYPILDANAQYLNLIIQKLFCQNSHP